MTNKYQNKYRISSTRLQNWDYGGCGAYFITICTRKRRHYFGEIVGDGDGRADGVETRCIASLPPHPPEMQLTTIGKIVEDEWIKTPEIRPDMKLELGVFVVMPNHFHGIILIGGGWDDCRDAMHRVVCRDAMHRVSTNHLDSTNHFAPQSKNLASIVRGFKSSVTMSARLLHIDFGWQPRFHDHIIRNAESFERIQNYILQNPSKWKEDTFHH